MAEPPGERSRPDHPRADRPRTRGPRADRPRADPARSAAFELLRAVDADDAYANLVWPRILAAHRLEGRDAAFATELGYGALRWRGRHDAILAACVDRGLGSVEPALLDALRLGVHQVHAMRVPEHAAVDTTVSLVRARVHAGAAGFANAVLRRVVRGGDAEAWLAALVAEGRLPALADDPAGHLAVTTSHPAWIVRAGHDALAASEPARTWADTSTALLADNRAATVTLVARSLARDALLEELHEAGVEAEPGRWSRLAVRVAATDPGRVAAVATGAAGVQDEGSQVVALALADAPLAGPDTRWLDLCAGPGGKAALLAAAVADRGGSLTAVELHPHRAQLVRNALRPIRGRHEVVVGDALTAPLEGGFDRVLVDAPCTGLGALRRRPESRWRRRAEDLPELTALQRRLLARALELVRPGGLVLYATCSPHLAETDAVIGDVHRHGGAVLPLGAVPGLALPPAAVADRALRLWPHVHDTDGMFAALIRREA
ncbi:MAG TPA: transcription antitermination factor NusB [Candidatus Nanopelagicales bacterium]